MPNVTSLQHNMVEDMVLSHYAKHPDLIRSLLERLGAHNVRPIAGGFHCTCPIHGGTNPTGFAVFYERIGIPIWKCYTDCQAKGRLTSILMRKYHVPFKKALSWLASVAGISVDGLDMSITPARIEEESIEAFNQRLGITIASTPKVFQESMIDESMEVKCDYFERRGITRSTLRNFQVGFVPGGKWVWDSPDDPKKKTGWFESRVSIPWRLADNTLIGFAGRRTDDLEYMKYKTLPGTMKSLSVYGLHQPWTKQAIQQERHLIIVEGYMDVWRAWDHTVYNTVAIGGTELSGAQTKIIKGLDLDRVTIYLDGDAAGRTAATKVAEQLSTAFRVYMAISPEGKDPGDLTDSVAFMEPIAEAKIFASRKNNT